MNKYYAPPGGIPGEFATVRDTRRYGRYTGGSSVPAASSGTVKGTNNGDGGIKNHTHTGCGSDAASRYGLKGYPVGSTYAPLQDFDGLYERSQALARGTLFSALDLPFLGYGGAGVKSLNGGCRRG